MEILQEAIIYDAKLMPYMCQNYIYMCIYVYMSAYIHIGMYVCVGVPEGHSQSQYLPQITHKLIEF